MRKTAFLLLLPLAWASVRAASSIVVSDGPSESVHSGSSSGSGLIVTTDGPREWTQAARDGVHLYGQWVVESEGPGTARIVGTPSDPSASPFPSPVFAKTSESATNTAANTQKIVISDGPGTAWRAKHSAKPVIKLAHAKKEAPVVDAESSTLAPIIPTTARAQGAQQAAAAPAGTAIAPLQSPSTSEAFWKALVLTLSFLVAVLLGTLFWTLRKRAF